MALAPGAGPCYPCKMIQAALTAMLCLAAADGRAAMRLPEAGGTLLAFVPTGAGYQLDRLFDAARGRVMSTDSLPPPPHPPNMAREYRRTFKTLMTHRSEIDRFDAAIVKQAEINRLDPTLLKAIIASESEFKTNARSPAGALGLMQLLPKTAEGFGVAREKLFDAQANIKAGAAYLGELFSIIYRRAHLHGLYSQAPRWVVRRVVAAYNAGVKFLRPRRLWRETRKYVAKVLVFKDSAVAKIRASR